MLFSEDSWIYMTSCSGPPAIKRPHRAFQSNLPHKNMTNKHKWPKLSNLFYTLNSKELHFLKSGVAVWGGVRLKPSRSNESESLKVWCARSRRGGLHFKSEDIIKDDAWHYFQLRQNPTAFKNRRGLALQQIFGWIFLNRWVGELMKPPAALPPQINASYESSA